VGEETKVLVQGITGKEGRFHTEAMLRYGTRILAGVSPGRAGEKVSGVPVYNTVDEAVKRHEGINASIIFVPAPWAPDAVYEAIDAGIRLIVVITEGIPVHETVRLVRYAKLKGVTIVGPNCPGVISPGRCKLGIMPGHVFSQGRVGMVSRSGTLSYEIAWSITRSGVGESTVLGIGGDPVTGISMIEALELFRNDEETSCVVLVGEIGGDAEERAARYIVETRYPKPVVGFIAGRTAPPGKRMGHAGAIISMGKGDAESKIASLREAGVKIADTPTDVGRIVKQLL